MKEQWKIIDEFPDYAVSDRGRVKRVTAGQRTRAGSLLKASPTSKRVPYLRVTLRRDGKSFSKMVHRLVAEHFIPNPKNLAHVNHVGTSKTDNRATRLEWRSAAGHGFDRAKRQQQGDGVAKTAAGRFRANYSPEPNKRVHIGTFDSFEQALQARNEAMNSLAFRERKVAPHPSGKEVTP